MKGCEAALDVLAFEGDEALSTPFRYRIEFTSGDHAISKEMMLMKGASLTLQAPAAPVTTSKKNQTKLKMPRVLVLLVRKQQSQPVIYFFPDRES
nr:hypothetical protein [Enterobacter bugandensis]